MRVANPWFLDIFWNVGLMLTAYLFRDVIQLYDVIHLLFTFGNWPYLAI